MNLFQNSERISSAIFKIKIFDFGRRIFANKFFLFLRGARKFFFCFLFKFLAVFTKWLKFKLTPTLSEWIREFFLQLENFSIEQFTATSYVWSLIWLFSVNNVMWNTPSIIFKNHYSKTRKKIFHFISLKQN